jgi:hypothetical protein
MYRVSDRVANLITTEDAGVHRENATEKNGFASLPFEVRLPDVKALPTIEVHSKIL